MTNRTLTLSVVLVVLIAAYIVVDYLHEIGERRTVLETYDDAEARKFMLECDGTVMVYTNALKHTLSCYKKK